MLKKNIVSDLKEEEGRNIEISESSKKILNNSFRVGTGIKGFDVLVEGGFPRNSITLITGTPGTGKTLFGLEYLYHGAKKFGEKGVFITFEQNLEDIRNQAKKIGLDLISLEKKGLLILIHLPVKTLDKDSLEKLKLKIKGDSIKRVVIDSISTLSINAPIYSPVKDIALRDIMNYKAFFSPPILGDFVINRFIYNFIDELRGCNCTTLLISEGPEKGAYLSRDTISEFVSDGVIVLTFESMGGEYSRSLMVRKMRGTNNDEDVHPLEISGNGLIVHNLMDN